MQSRSPGSEISILLVSDPGLPSRRLEAAIPRLESELRRRFDARVSVRHRIELIRMHPDFELDTETARRLAAEYGDVGATVLLTEVPRYRSGRPLVAEAIREPGIGIVSFPTLGAGGRNRLLRAVLGCVLELRPAPVASDADAPRVEGRWREGADGAARELRASSLVGVPRLVLGMVLANEPWRTAPKLSSALAAGLAVGAFGIFYNSIWQMADALSTARLLSIALLAVATMVAWLMLKNGLWERGPLGRGRAVMMLYNATTIATLTLCVLAMYLVLATVIFLAGLVVIDPGFMSTVLESEARLTNYVDVAWLSAAMGTVAGALGSQFDSDTDVRRLTHGQRERQRVRAEDEG
ncbi:hypothetical protein [Gulosibacter sp. 10]|uniref:hypothetical protein n=1 Tax=Gulosibacter sp. 10 TaxID=1255570 RepID=UPI00097EB864|nr:hypothetical protein [Gulosibacter sp. 10]SJM60534.1 hypothetical protein FM112_07225 [Gulosibacter sp. 10]